MAIRLILEEDGTVKALDFDADSVTIGRVASNDIPITSSTSSRQHCRVSRSANGFFVEDLKSRNGTQVNGEAITRRQLDPGDRIEIGTSILHFEKRLEGGQRAEARKAPRSSERRRRDAPAAATPPAALGFELCPIEPAGRPVKLESFPFMIGSRDTNALVLSGKDVAPEHCMVVPANDGLFLVDLGSPAGTIVNGKRITREALVAGQKLEIGRAVLLLKVVGGSGSAPPKSKQQVVVDEVDDLDALGEDDDEPVESPKALPKSDRRVPRSDRQSVPTSDRIPKSDRVARSEREKPAEPGRSRREAAAPVVEEDNGLGTELGQISAQTIERAAPPWLILVQGLAALVVVCVIVGTAGVMIAQLVRKKEADPADAENLVENWSFEAQPAANGQIPGWDFTAPEGVSVSIVDRPRFGAKALELRLAAGQLASAASRKVVFRDDAVLTGHGVFEVEGDAVKGLRVDWLDANDQVMGSSLVVVSAKRNEERLSGRVAPPARATGARLVAFAEGLGNSLVRIDRLRLLAVQEPSPFERFEIDRAALEIESHGLVNVERLFPGGSELLVSELELALATGRGKAPDPYCRLAAGREESPLSLKGRKARLRTNVMNPDDREWRPIQVEALNTGSALQLNYRCPRETISEAQGLCLSLAVSKRASAQALLVVDESGQSTSVATLFEKSGADSFRVPQIREFIFGEGEQQISLKATRPGELAAWRRDEGLLLNLSYGRAELSNPDDKDLNLGLELASSSSVEAAQIRSLFAEAQKARQAGDLKQSLELYREISRRFSDPRAQTLASARASEIEDYANRLLRELEIAGRDVETVASVLVLNGALRREARIVEGFPGDQKAERAESLARDVKRRYEQSQVGARQERARSLLDQAQALRREGRDALARAVLAEIVASFPAELEAVKEAAGTLERMGGR